MEERRRGDDLDIVLREAEQFRIADEIVAVRVMSAEGNENADVVQNRRVAQELSRRVRLIVQPECQRAVKKRQGQIRHMQGMLLLKTQARASLNTLWSRMERSDCRAFGTVCSKYSTSRPSRRPRLLISQVSQSISSMIVWRMAAPGTMTAARFGLMPGRSARSA